MKRKCELLQINRSGLYYQKKETLSDDVELMNKIREIYLKYPFLGYRKMRIMLAKKGFILNHKKVQRLMQKAGIKALYPKKKTTIRNKEHAIYPYLLKNIDINRPNCAWQVDITYIRIRGGFVYLNCLIDVYSRKIMGWDLSIFLDTPACLRALENALTKEHPEIVNSDQGCQFTSNAWCNILTQNNIKISMDGKGRWADNIYIERFWRTIKYELVYLHRFETVLDARHAIADYIEFYNAIRPHQALKYRTPNQVYQEFNYELEKSKKFENVLPLLGAFNDSQIFEQKLS